jgi:hypothetical protein
MEKLELAMKTIEKADEMIDSFGKIMKLVSEINANIPRSLESRLSEEILEFGIKAGAYKQLKDLL